MEPDFSGVWKLDLAASRIEIEKPTSTLFVIEHREPVFRLTRTHVYGEKSDRLTFELTTDGRETTLGHGPVEARMRMRWEGDALVVDVNLRSETDEGMEELRYRLENGGRTLVADERIETRMHKHHNLWVFQRE